MRRLDRAGFESFVVGGCVRDSLLGSTPQDWDVTTSAKPQEVKSVFGRTLDTGLKHGTVTIMRGKVGYEVTTYRMDGAYLDGRHPSEVTFTGDLTQDLKRRDFTINAMAYHPDVGLVDAFGGMDDLHRRVIRCVGGARDRFGEDALRMLRAVRFSAQLGFSIDGGTRDGVRALATNLTAVSKERIQAELTKLLLSAHPDRAALLWELGLAEYMTEGFAQLPAAAGWGASAAKSGRVEAYPDTEAAAGTEDGTGAGYAGVSAYVRLKDFPPDKCTRYGALFAGISPKEGESILRQLRMDTDTIHMVKLLLLYQSAPLPEEKPALRRMMAAMRPHEWDALLDFREALEKGSRVDAKSDSAVTRADAWSEMQPGAVISHGGVSGAGQEYVGIQRIRSLTKDIRAAGDCLYLKDLAIDGSDLGRIGFVPGKAMGQALNTLLVWVWEDPARNTKDALERRALAILGGD
ncbi:MAG: polynucleotide adenylyltransferase [Lachnospiraceae bacterium]|nr:polynucleotide adenylyltransferase [Lachnospiraceae bacterium]